MSLTGVRDFSTNGWDLRWRCRPVRPLSRRRRILSPIIQSLCSRCPAKDRRCRIARFFSTSAARSTWNSPGKSPSTAPSPRPADWKAFPSTRRRFGEASEAAVAAFAPDAYAHMIEALCGGDPRATERVRQRVRAMTGNLDVFQLRPEVDGLLRRLRGRGLKLGIVANQPETARERLARAG